MVDKNIFQEIFPEMTEFGNSVIRIVFQIYICAVAFVTVQLSKMLTKLCLQEKQTWIRFCTSKPKQGTTREEWNTSQGTFPKGLVPIQGKLLRC